MRLAALLHDSGHGPFSHVFEIPMEKHSAIGREEKKPPHEVISAWMVRNTPELREILADDAEQVADLISPSSPKLNFQHDIISGMTDADKMDYLIRDSHFAGVRYGVFDLDWLINSATLHPEFGRTDRYHLAFRANGELAVEQFVIAKYYMTSQVYAHRIRCIADSMLVRAIDLCIAAGDVRLQPILTATEVNDAFIAEYLDWDDSRLLHHFMSHNDTRVRNLGTRLRRRALYKQVFEAVSLERDGAPGLDSFRAFEEYLATHSSVYEAAVARALAVEPWEVIVDLRYDQSPGRLGPRDDNEKVALIDKDGREVPPTRGVLSELPGKPQPYKGTKKIYVYARADSLEEKASHRSKSDHVREAIRGAVLSVSAQA